MDYHSRCDDEGCIRRCRRPGCLEPGVHWFAKAERQDKTLVSFHRHYDCTVLRLPLPLNVASAAKQAIEELNPNMTPSDVAAARRVIGKMLDRLEMLERTTVTVVEPPPLLLTAAKDDQRRRPKVVAITHARESHLEWLARKDGKKWTPEVMEQSA